MFYANLYFKIKFLSMQNNYDFPDHSIHNSSKQHANRYEYSNQLPPEYFHEMEELSQNEISGDEDYPNLMKCDSFNSSQQQHSYGGERTRQMIMSSDFFKNENSKINLQPNNNCYSNPNTFFQKRRTFPEVVNNDGNKRGNDFYSEHTSSQQSNWQPIQEESTAKSNINNSKVQLNRIVTTQSKIERINIEDENQMEYLKKKGTPPVSKVQSVVQLMNKFEKTLEIPQQKNKQYNGNGRTMIKQQSLPYPLDFDDDRKEVSRETADGKNKKIGKVANTVKQLQQKLHPHLKNIKEEETKKNVTIYNGQNSEYFINKRKKLNDILPEPLLSEGSELSGDMKRLSTESDFTKDIPLDLDCKKNVNTSITSTLSKNMAKEARMLMEYFQRRRPLLNYLGVGLSDQLWEQVNSLPPKTVRLIYEEDLGNIQHNFKQKEAPRLMKRLSVRSSIRQDPRKIALKKKLLHSKMDNHDSNYSKIDKSLKKQIKDPNIKPLNLHHNIILDKSDEVMVNDTKINYNQLQDKMKNKYTFQKQPNIFENQYEEEEDENNYINHIKKDSCVNESNIHENHNNFEEETPEYIEDSKNNFDNSGTLQNVDTKSGRFIKKSAAALIAKRHANDPPINCPIRSNSSSSIVSRHSISNVNNKEKDIHHGSLYEKDRWNQNIPSSKDYMYNSIEKDTKRTGPSIGQRQYLRPSKSLDHLMFENTNEGMEMFEENNLPNYDINLTKISSHQQLHNGDYENPPEVDEIGMPRIPPHRGYTKNSTIQRMENNEYEEDRSYHDDYTNNQFLYAGARPFIPKQVASSKNIVDYSNNTLREKKSMAVESRSKKGTWRLYGSLSKLFKKRAAIRL
uniref:INCENP_ARK-bind domain-containing protein n=1 Tax=Strongyloides papillosus TaxID=174720 RepID=A0A0N5B7A9_STREA